MVVVKAHISRTGNAFWLYVYYALTFYMYLVRVENPKYEKYCIPG